MNDGAYSDLKAVWHLDRIATLRSGGQIAPTQVQLILSDLCNQDCHFCAYRMSGGLSTEQFAELKDGKVVKNPNRMIPYLKSIEILDDCKTLGVRAIQFTGGGEPTVHPKHMDLFRHALDNGMDCGLVTNGVLLRDGWRDVLPRFKWIRVSIDSGTSGTYSKVRNVPPAIFGKVIANLADLVEATKHTDTLLGVGYVVTLENYKELPAACEFFRDLSVPYVRLSAMFSTSGTSYYADKWEEVRASVNEAKKIQTSRFKIVDLSGERLADLEQGAPDYEFCGYQQFNMYIGGNLKVYRCCTTSYTKHGEVGDLKDKRLVDWFYSDQKRDSYKNFDARSCNTCQFNGKNRVINYSIQGEPLHVNFV